MWRYVYELCTTYDELRTRIARVRMTRDEFWYKYLYLKEKKEEIWVNPMTKAPVPAGHKKVKRQHKDPQKTSITQWLRSDLGRTVTSAIQLLW